MSKQLMIYNTAGPVSRARHFDASLEASGHYAFSAGINSVPLTAVEFPQAMTEYPIVFAGAPGELTPAVILGLRAEENLFLAADSSWTAKYLPAFLRRYPFVFSLSEDRFLLCVDEEFPGFNRAGRGQAFFGADGEMTPFVGNVLAFLQEYQAQFQRTKMFCNKVEELGLLEPMQAQITIDGSEKTLLSGFLAVNRARLKELSGDKLVELAATDELELLYLHLQSMNNFDTLKNRMLAARQALAMKVEETVPEGAIVQ
jgi:hypothetical protein